MHGIICIKQRPALAKICARLLSNTIVQRGVPTNRYESVAAEAPPSSLASGPVRSACMQWDRICLSFDCERCAPWIKVRCCSSTDPRLTTRRYPRCTNARPRSGRSRSCLLGSLSASSASRPSMTTWPRSAPESRRGHFRCSSTSSPQSLASISPPAASRAEHQGARPPRKRPSVRAAISRRTRSSGPCSTDSPSQNPVLSRRRVDRKENATP